MTQNCMAIHLHRSFQRMKAKNSRETSGPKDNMVPKDLQQMHTQHPPPIPSLMHEALQTTRGILKNPMLRVEMLSAGQCIRLEVPSLSSFLKV